MTRCFFLILLSKMAANAAILLGLLTRDKRHFERSEKHLNAQRFLPLVGMTSSRRKTATINGGLSRHLLWQFCQLRMSFRAQRETFKRAGLNFISL
jgi:hypothetical protein